MLHSKISTIFFSLLILCVPIFLLEPKYVEKFFYLTALGAVCLLIVNRKKIKFDALSLSLLIFSILTLIWAYSQQADSTQFLSTYRSYKEAGKIALAMAIIIIAINSLNLKLEAPSIFLCLIPFFSLLIIILFFRDDFFISNRLSIHMPATLTAYFFTFITIAFLSIPNVNVLFKLVIALFMYYLIFLTGTRAGIIIFPILLIMFLLFGLEKIKNKKNIFLLFLIGFLAVGLMSKDTLISRSNDIFNDLTAYSKNNSNTSIGARFTMMQIGVKTGGQHLLGQSIESRNQDMKVLVLEDKKLGSAMEFSDVHLHNDLIDLYSLKGLFGAISYLILITSLLYITFKDKNIYLLMFTIATVAYGMSDMVFYGRNMMLMWAVACIIIHMSSVKNMVYRNE